MVAVDPPFSWLHVDNLIVGRNKMRHEEKSRFISEAIVQFYFKISSLVTLCFKRKLFFNSKFKLNFFKL
jgi:hypothetical protein